MPGSPGVYSQVIWHLNSVHARDDTWTHMSLTPLQPPQGVHSSRPTTTTFAVDAMAGVDGAGAAKRRRERRLRAHWRHEQQTVAVALCVARHHSSGFCKGRLRRQSLGLTQAFVVDREDVSWAESRWVWYQSHSVGVSHVKDELDGRTQFVSQAASLVSSASSLFCSPRSSVVSRFVREEVLWSQVAKLLHHCDGRGHPLELGTPCSSSTLPPAKSVSSCKTCLPKY